MNADLRLENSRTVASLLGLSEEEAASLLDCPVQVTWGPEDTTGHVLGRLVVTMLARTFAQVGGPDTPVEGAVAELLIDGAQAMTRGRAVYCRIGLAGAACGPADPGPFERHGQEVPQILCLYVACFAAAQVTNYALGLPAGRVSTKGVQIDFNLWPGVPLDTFDDAVDLGEMQVAGAGAVGNAVLYAFQFLPVSGDGDLIDPKRIASGILNRCLWFEPEHIDEPKVAVLAHKVEEAIPTLTLRPLAKTIDQARADVGEFTSMVVGVDSRRARRGLQKEIPLEVFDASTTGIEEVVFHHNRQFNGGACMGCIYPETEHERQFRSHLAEVLNVSEKEIEQTYVSQQTALKIQARYPEIHSADIVGIAYDTLFRQLCATAQLKTPEQKQVLAPFAFVSQLAGVVLAIEYFLRRRDSSRTKTFNYWRVNPWRGPVIGLQQWRGPLAACSVCRDPDYQAAAAAVWGKYKD